MLWGETRGEETKGRDHGQIDSVAHRHELRALTIIKLCDRLVVAWINLDDAALLENDLGFVIAHAIDLVRDLLEVRLPHKDTHRLFAAERHIAGQAGQRDRRRSAPRIGERVVRQLNGFTNLHRFSVPFVVWPNERLCDWDLVHAVFGQRDADGIADSIREERADSDG